MGALIDLVLIPLAGAILGLFIGVLIEGPGWGPFVMSGMFLGIVVGLYVGSSRVSAEGHDEDIAELKQKVVEQEQYIAELEQQITELEDE